MGLGEGGDQVASLGRAVIGGLAAGTLTTLFVLPAISHLLLRGRHKHHVPGDYTDVGPFGQELPETT